MAKTKKHLSPELKHLVNRSVRLLGRTLQNELGVAEYRRIEKLRHSMTGLRTAAPAMAAKKLRKHFAELKKTSSSQRLRTARAFTLMLELMNTCENAYRTVELQRKALPAPSAKGPDSIVYVLTAHPTEARSPQNIALFHHIQDILIEMLKRPAHAEALEPALMHWLEMVWHTPIVRHRTPRVKDEADHIYSTLFRKPVFLSLLELIDQGVPFSVHTWVGGDKDGHPGVQERTLLESLNLSRQHILKLFHENLQEIRQDLRLTSKNSELLRGLHTVEKKLVPLKTVRPSDGPRVRRLQAQLQGFQKQYQKVFHLMHPQLLELTRLFQLFPALVVPLELRESSDVLMTWPQKGQKLAIEKMLWQVQRISAGFEPRYYARGFIISMAESLQHLQKVADLQMKTLGAIRLPIIPLFEQTESLAQSEAVIRQTLRDPRLRKALKKYWNNKLEMMVGYSDSSKEAGVLASRLAIAEALPRLEKLCLQEHITPVFFHGSGGSTDRGGGSIEDQTAWWPRSALRRYKVTVQGEMVERSLATPEIAQSQVEHILASAAKGLQRAVKIRRHRVLENFAQKSSEAYRQQVTSPSFLEMVEKATPYSYLNFLKIGSRPAKRATQLQVSGLRAIPWILCWTQTRVLFPTWWGVGSAWQKSTPSERRALRKVYRQEPVFTSYVKALGYTLAKIEMPVWQMYLEQSPWPANKSRQAFKDFQAELQWARHFFHEVSGLRDETADRPWLGESIRLRSAMIHPLNLLQILAEREQDANLLRVTVTGISAGMLTTG